MDRQVILLDGFGITASDLVPPSTIAILLQDGEVRVVSGEKRV